MNRRGSPLRRHILPAGAGANYAFSDGHVKWYKPRRTKSGTVLPEEGTFSLHQR